MSVHNLVDESFLASSAIIYLIMWWWGGNFSGIVLGVRGFFIVLSVVTINTLFTLFTKLIIACHGAPTNHIRDEEIYSWLALNFFTVDICFESSIFSLLMSIMILIVFFAVLVFSYSYMRADPFIINFFSYLSAFVGSMLLLVGAGNFVLFFVGWEGVGLSSFLLINFWTTRLQTSKSGLKALLINRIGDFFLLLAILFTYKLTRSFDFQTIFISAVYLKTVIIPGYNVFYIDVICICLLLAAMSKSAQAGLHIWLPDAMEGPTPVSAMIHAATMVTAGLYLLLRCSFLIVLSPIALYLIFFIGIITVLLTSVLGMWQYDIKKIIAFSTCSQLGYMMTIIGNSYFSLGFFHLLTHAFFKALLFLAAGGVIHAMQGEQDLRRLAGGLSTTNKIWSSGLLQSAFLVGTLSIVGVTFFSGYYSKETILFSLAFSVNTNLGLLSCCILLSSVFFTSYYSFRLFWLLFLTPERSTTRYYQVNSTLKADKYITVALSILMFFSLTSGFGLKNLTVNSTLMSHVLHSSAVTPAVLEFFSWHIKVLPLILVFLGFYVAFYQEELAEYQQKWKTFSYFMQSKYYYDNLFNKITKWLLRRSFRVYKYLDKGLLEWLGPQGISLILKSLSRSTDYALFDKRIETSYLGFLIGVILLFFIIAETFTITDWLFFIL